MKLFRTSLLAAVAGLGLMLPLAGPSRAQADQGMSQPHCRHHAVYYRSNAAAPWIYYGTYRTSAHARQAADWLEYSYGGQTFIKCY